MPREIDEDLIEATIRRVAEQAARSQQSPGEDDAEPAPDVLRDRAATAPPETPAAEDEPDEATDDGRALERLRYDDHESFGRAGGPRRFSAEMPGGLARSPWSPVTPPPDTADEEDVIGEIGAPKDEAVSAAEPEAQPAAALDDTAAPELQPVAQAPGAGAWSTPPAATSGAETPVTEMAGTAGTIIDRLDRIIALLERLADGSAMPTQGGQRPMPMPARAPLSRAAVAEQLQPDRIDTRPIPQPLPPLQVEPRRGLELLPRTYRITVEDKRQGVDLVPLHRALLGMDGVKDMSLLSYNNGVAIVALEMTRDIEQDVLRAAVTRAMSREAKVEQHNEHTFVVKLAEE